jgi:DNA-binding transcriptional LysR family regulator
MNTPSDQALRILESAVRLGAFSQAAEELHMTRAAVGAQIKALEQGLGVLLFERGARSVTPTTAAVNLARQLATAYRQVDEAVQVAQQPVREQTIVVSAVPNLASAWLLPRLHAWWALYPQVQIELLSSTRLSSLGVDRVDVAIRDGYGDWPGLNAARLMPMRLAPVVATALSAQLRGDTEALLSSQRWFGLQAREWRLWLREEGLPESLLDRCRFTPWECWRLVGEAALSGAGVALVPLALYDRDLKAGRLAQVGHRALSLPRAHWVLTHPRPKAREMVRVFVDWLHVQAATSAVVS